MEISDYIAIFCFILTVLYFILFQRYEKRLNAKIQRLKDKIDSLVTNIESNYFDEEAVPEIKIMQLMNQAKKLEFCFRCPLYRDKAREDCNKKP